MYISVNYFTICASPSFQWLPSKVYYLSLSHSTCYRSHFGCHSADHDARQQVLNAMDEFHKYTCIQFKRRQSEHDYLVIGPSNVCGSRVGRQGGPQFVHIGPDCTRSLGTPMHELMHALGFLHEHMRPDRDKYVYINYSNIDKGIIMLLQIYLEYWHCSSATLQPTHSLHWDGALPPTPWHTLKVSTHYKPVHTFHVMWKGGWAKCCICWEG